MRVLHLGCGRKGHKLVGCEQFGPSEIISLDADARLNPDIICCLGKQSIPLPDDSIDKAVAIHVLEHIGKQGETDEWFKFFEDLYRVLKPEGKLIFESPLWSGVWAWGDPSHVRALSPESFIFFDQDNYRIKESAISPFRIKCDFVPEGFTGLKVTPDGPAVHFSGTLTTRKPLTPWWEDIGFSSPSPDSLS